MTKNSKLSAPAPHEFTPKESRSDICAGCGGLRITPAHGYDLERAALSTPAASPSRGNEAPHNSVTARFGFGEFDVSTLKEDEFVTASGLNDGGWVVCKRPPSTPEETGPHEMNELRELLSKITPGPWRRGQVGNLRIYGPDARHEHSGMLAKVCSKNGAGKANAELIAMAPKLLEKVLAGAAPSSVTPREDILKWLDAYGIAQDFDTNDGIALIQAWESARASSPSSATEPQNEWISVDEKLPAANWYGLFITNENYIELGSFRDDPDEKPCWVCERTAPQDETIKYVNQDGQVTHWRELPKPPSSALSAPGLLLAANLAEQHGKDYVSNAPPRIALNFLAAELRRLAAAESGVPLEEKKENNNV